MPDPLTAHSAGWVQHAIWWQVYPLGFVDAPKVRDVDAPVQHTLRRMVGWLDHAVELGVNGLALQPVFESSSHGYDTSDYFRIDPRLGDESDFAELVHACRDRGIRVMLDGVFNHVGVDHPRFREVVERGPDAASADWFRVRFPKGWKPGDVPEYDTFEGATQLVALNHDNPQVADLVVDAMCHWLERGIDAWRLDAAYAVEPTFWNTVLPKVRARFPDVYVVGEVIHGDYPRIVTESGMDSVTQYELWKAAHSSLASRNFWELDHALGRHNTFLDTFVPLTFLGNHDTTRIASQLGDDRLLPLALAMLFTIGGTPMVYYGDELGWKAVKEERLGGDDAIRPPFPGTPADLDPGGRQVFESHQELIGFRRRNPWLHHARTEVTQLSNTEIVYDASDGEHRITVALNCGDGPSELQLTGLTEILAGGGEIRDGTVYLDEFGWVVLG